MLHPKLSFECFLQGVELCARGGEVTIRARKGTNCSVINQWQYHDDRASPLNEKPPKSKKCGLLVRKVDGFGFDFDKNRARNKKKSLMALKSQYEHVRRESDGKGIHGIMSELPGTIYKKRFNRPTRKCQIEPRIINQRLSSSLDCGMYFFSYFP